MGVKSRWGVAAAALLAVAAAGVAVAMAATSSGTSSGTVKAAHSSKFGTLIVSASGMTLYHYTPDKLNGIKCTGACAQFWPPLTVPAGTKPKAGSGLSAAKLSTVKRPDGKTQVTYAGLTLYRYSGDKHAGQVNGEGFQRKWFAVSSSGRLVKAAVSGGVGTTPTTTSPTTTGGYGYGGGGY
jgi:predicted lipoprotein with Yx(FWY)xxD motif